MKTCTGYVRARNEAQAWKRCGRHPLRGDQLCAGHRGALDSALRISARWRKKALREAVHPMRDTRKVVAANLDAQVARTGPGKSVSRSLLAAISQNGVKEKS
jgi:hypothetical protein